MGAESNPRFGLEDAAAAQRLRLASIWLIRPRRSAERIRGVIPTNPVPHIDPSLIVVHLARLGAKEQA